MAKKGHYEKIYKRFKNEFPDIVEQLVKYRPYDYVSILLDLKDGTQLIYDDDKKLLCFNDGTQLIYNDNKKTLN